MSFIPTKYLVPGKRQFPTGAVSMSYPVAMIGG
jgi:hypothetical protein